jgi:hypothetical protein
MAISLIFVDKETLFSGLSMAQRELWAEAVEGSWGGGGGGELESFRC